MFRSSRRPPSALRDGGDDLISERRARRSEQPKKVTVTLRVTVTSLSDMRQDALMSCLSIHVYDRDQFIATRGACHNIQTRFGDP